MRELRTCPVEGTMVVINDALDVRPGTRSVPPVARGQAVPMVTPVLGVEGEVAVRREPWVARDGLGAHEMLGGDLPEALRLATARMADLRLDGRLLGFGVGGVAEAGVCEGLELVALPFEHRLSAPHAWRDAEIGGPRCAEVTESAVAIFAWAPRGPGELWVMPRVGRRRFEQSQAQGVVGELAARWVRWLHAELGGSVGVRLVDGEGWRLELVPWVERGVFELTTSMPEHGAFPERVREWATKS